jgi:hypothetical protein
MKIAEEKNVFLIEDEGERCNEVYSQRRDRAKLLT